MRLLRNVATFLAVAGFAVGQSQALTPPIPPLDGVYRVQPGGVVVGCGGLYGDCRAFTLEGTLELDHDFVAVRIAKSDLRLRDDNGAWTFPGSSDLPLVGLSGPVMNNGAVSRVELNSQGDHGQGVALELISVGVVGNLVGHLRLALRGTYDEGCCDRFVYEFGNVRLEPEIVDGLALGLQESPRFVVNVTWATNGAETRATPERLGANLGYFWFFTADNPEIFVKVVDACDTKWNRVWFFASGLTNLGVRIEVTDQWNGVKKTYLHPGGSAFVPVQDTGGFPCSFVS